MFEDAEFGAEAVLDAVLGDFGLDLDGFGSGGTSSTVTGDPLGVAGSFGQIIVPSGYLSSSPLSTNDTWDGVSLADLGITPGIYKWTWGSGADADSLTLYAGVSPVPEPASVLLLILGAAGLAFAPKLYRKRKRPLID